MDFGNLNFQDFHFIGEKVTIKFKAKLKELTTFDMFSSYILYQSECAIEKIEYTNPSVSV